MGSLYDDLAPPSEIAVRPRVRSFNLSAGAAQKYGSSAVGQIVYAVSEPFEVRILDQIVQSPRGGAIWLPPSLCYALTGGGEAQRVEIGASRCKELPLRSRVLILPLFVRQLLSYLASEEKKKSTTAKVDHATNLAIEELIELLQVPKLPIPSDHRLSQIAKAVVANPADNTDLACWGNRVGLSTRHISRMFYSETGLGFADWRAQVRADHAKELLSGRRSITAVAESVGYTSKGAFIRMFKRVTGTTPRRYVQSSRGAG